VEELIQAARITEAAKRSIGEAADFSRVVAELAASRRQPKRTPRNFGHSRLRASQSSPRASPQRSPTPRRTVSMQRNRRRREQPAEDEAEDERWLQPTNQRLQTHVDFVGIAQDRSTSSVNHRHSSGHLSGLLSRNGI